MKQDKKQEQKEPLLDLFKSMNKCVEDFWKGVYVKNENKNKI